MELTRELSLPPADSMVHMTFLMMELRGKECEPKLEFSILFSFLWLTLISFFKVLFTEIAYRENLGKSTCYDSMREFSVHGMLGCWTLVN